MPVDPKGQKRPASIIGDEVAFRDCAESGGDALKK